MSTFFQNAALEADSKEIARGDSIDLKAAVFLALIAVLVAGNGALLAIPHLPKCIEVLQIVSLLLSTLAVLPCVGALFHIPYEREDFPSSAREFVSAIEEKVGDESLTGLSQKAIRDALDRAQKNWKINRVRIFCMVGAFIVSMLALFLNIATIASAAIYRMAS